MIDDLHHLVRMHLHDDLRWRFAAGDAIVLRPYRTDSGASEQLDALCRRLGFEDVGEGVWRVAQSSPHYDDLWVYVEQNRIDEGW